ncbi:MAG: hypothetical protein ACYC0X_22585 [Pirellulaceae bacterium]
MRVVTHRFLWSVLFLFVAQAALAEPLIKTVKPDGSPNRAAWMAQGGFGVMTHYLISPQGNTLEEKTADLNRIVVAFDVDSFVKQLEETGADWLIFTLGQGTGFLSSRNEFIDGLEPGYTPQRDLIPEIGRRLHERGKRLIIYLPGAHTPADPTVKRILGLGSDGYADRHNAFIRHYSQKMGECCDGWWFDSCGRQENVAWQKEMEACQAGNPDAVIAFSGAEFCASGGQLKPICPIEDYHAGEIHLLEEGKIRTDFIWPPGEGILISADAKLRKAGQEAKFYMPDAQFIDNVQWHCLLPIDLTFNPAVPNQYCHYTDKQLFQFTDAVKSVGGAITINVPIETETGHIPQDTHAQLVRLAQHLKAKKLKTNSLP